MKRKVLISDLVETGEKIRALRESRGMSQEQFAELLGVSKNSIQRYELGTVEMGLTTFFKLAELAKCSPNEISPKRFTPICDMDDETEEIISMICRLKNRSKKIAFPVIKELIRSLKHYRLKSVGLRAKALFVATESRCSV